LREGKFLFEKVIRASGKSFPVEVDDLGSYLSKDLGMALTEISHHSGKDNQQD